VRALSVVAGSFALQTGRMTERLPARDESFEEIVLPHLDAAYRLARWLLRNDHDAEDAVQDASLRAFRYFRTFTGGNGRAWFLSIVRNTCLGRRGRTAQAAEPFDEQRHVDSRSTPDPERLVLQTDQVALIERAMTSLPDRYRALLVLRELEGLSYRELADAMDMPMGTVMSSLSRARQAFRGAFVDVMKRSAMSPETDRKEHDADAVLV
jgi:RNA polymerase sigma-70 factor (ECF subfamily)